MAHPAAATTTLLSLRSLTADAFRCHVLRSRRVVKPTFCVIPETLALTELLIPSELPAHAKVQKVPSAPKQGVARAPFGVSFPAPAPLAAAATHANMENSKPREQIQIPQPVAPPPQHHYQPQQQLQVPIQTQPMLVGAAAASAASRPGSTSHMQRLRSLRTTPCTTPTLSPLSITSPKVCGKQSKLPRPAAGGGRAYAAYLKAWAKQAEAQGQPGMAPAHLITRRHAYGARSVAGSAPGSRNSTPGGQALRARPNVPPRHGGQPLQPSRIQGPLSHYTAASRRQAAAASILTGGAR
jgi:hypothetical protein